MKTKEIDIGTKEPIVIDKKENYLLEIIVFILSALSIVALTYSSQYINTNELGSIYLVRLCQFLIYIGFMAVSLLAALVTKQIAIFKISKSHLLKQIMWIFILAILFALTVGVLPNLISEEVNTAREFSWSDLIFSTIYYILFVGIGEEMYFRGYLQNQFKIWFKKFDYFAPLLTGLMFGALHYINGSLAQAIITSLLGVTFGYAHFYLKNCSLLSVSLGHGVYDLLIRILSYFSF